MNPGKLKLDRIDPRILFHLQQNSRVINVNLADAVGLSLQPLPDAGGGLEKAGYITGYAAQIQLQKLGNTLMVYTELTLAEHRAADFARFEAAIRTVDEITECHLVSGGYDYLLKFVTRSVTTRPSWSACWSGRSATRSTSVTSSSSRCS